MHKPGNSPFSHPNLLVLIILQYFLWYLILLPFYLPSSSLIRNGKLGIAAAGLWVLGQALWLQQGYNLEFLGLSAFVPGLFLASLIFFAVNVWILGIIVVDAGQDTDLAL